MLNMKLGCRVPFPEKRNESYMIEENMITANIDINKIESVMKLLSRSSFRIGECIWLSRERNRKIL